MFRLAQRIVRKETKAQRSKSNPETHAKTTKMTQNEQYTSTPMDKGGPESNKANGKVKTSMLALLINVPPTNKLVGDRQSYGRINSKGNTYDLCTVPPLL